MKRNTIGAILLSTFLVSNCFSFQSTLAASKKSLDDSLIGHYTFDNDTVDNLNVENISLTGEAYNGRLGTLANSNQTNITVGEGIFENALHFDGSESYLKIPKVINAKEDYTISLWLNYDGDIPSSGDSTNIVQQNGAGRTILLLKNKAYGTFVSGTNIISDKKIEHEDWHHVVIRSEVNTDKSITFKIYVNGILNKQEKITDTSLTHNGITDLLFGCHKNQNVGYSFNGSLDSLRIYNTAVDDEVIEKLFEEHGNVVMFRELQDYIVLATDMLENGILTEKYEEYRDLVDISEEAKRLKSNSEYKEIIRVKTNLIEAIDNYNKASNKLPTRININYNNVIKSIPDSFFGVNHRYHMDGYGSYNPETKDLYPEFRELTDSANFGSVRYPGGIVSNLFQWKRSIGEVSERITTIHGNWNEESITPNFGLDEAARYIIDESNGEMIYVYGFGNGSALDAADLVEYLNCEVGENYNGGIDWAKVRADNGKIEPYNVKNFEIGNEVDEGRGYWMQNSPDQWSGSGLDVATMYAEGSLRTFEKEKVCEIDNWNTTNDRSKASYFSDGTANQKKYMRYANDVTDQSDKSKAVDINSVHVYVNNKEWTIVNDLKNFDGNQNVVKVNFENGEILFGDNINGKIPQEGADIRVTYTVYKDGLADYYKEMKKVDSDIKIYSGYSNPNIARAISESEKASKDGGQFDGVAVHPYSRTENQIQDNDPLFYEKIMESIDKSVLKQVKTRQDELDKYWPDGNKKVAISEYGIFNHPGDVVQSYTHAVYIAANLIGFMDFNTAYTNKHCLIDFPGGDILGPGKQALIQSIKQNDGSFKFYGTPSLKVFSMFNEMSADELIDSEILNNKKFYKDVDSIYSMATKDEENMYLILVNVDREKSIDVDININMLESIQGKVAETMTLTAEDVYDTNSLDNPNNIDIVRGKVEIDSNNFGYKLPKNSIVSLKIPISSKEDIPDDNEDCDINEDGHVNIGDLAIVAKYQGDIVEDKLSKKSDVNKDGIVDITDIEIVMKNLLGT